MLTNGYIVLGIGILGVAVSYFLNIFLVRLLVVLLGGGCFVFGVWQHVEAAQWNRFYFYIACALIAPALAWLVVHDIPLKAPIVEKLPLDKQETTLKESPIDKKTEIIKQLNKFVRNGNALLLQIGSAPSSQFPSKYPLLKNMKPSPMELKIAEWSKDVYNYLIVDVQTWAEYYHNLSTRDIVIKHKPYTSPQQRYRASMIAIMESRIDRILEIVKLVNNPGN